MGDMHCERMAAVRSMEELLMLGIWVGLLASIIFIDWFTRKGALLASLALTLTGLALTIAGTALATWSVGLFLWAAGAEISYSILLIVLA